MNADYETILWITYPKQNHTKIPTKKANSEKNPLMLRSSNLVIIFIDQKNEIKLKTKRMNLINEANLDLNLSSTTAKANVINRKAKNISIPFLKLSFAKYCSMSYSIFIIYFSSLDFDRF